MKAYIETLRKQLTTVARDLDSMPREQAGTKWHLDRVDEARWLVAELQKLAGL